MKWKKLGLIFAPAGERSWMQSHASVPVPIRLAGERYRLLFTTRDADNRPRIGFVEIDLSAPTRVLCVSGAHVLGPGPAGFFDDGGVYPGCLVRRGRELWMYYQGRSSGIAPLYYVSIGLAVSDDEGLSFHRRFDAPILARSEHDPWMAAKPFVLADGGLWRMWYTSGLRWDLTAEPSRSYYHIKYAESDDGVTWRRDGRVCIDFHGRESNVASPTVLKDGDLYRMWFCSAAGEGYRIGYAESADGYTWSRKDSEAGIDLSPSGWDSEAMAYPCVFVHEGRRYLLYSGNGYGRDGFGLAVEDAAT
jgi:predicted GH43/DUF377 family glycosyl hydrolase